MLILSGCGVPEQTLGETLAESMEPIFAVSFTQTLLGIGFGQAYHHETGRWPESVEQIKIYCVGNDEGDICELLDHYEQIRFEPNEVEPNVIDFEFFFASGGRIAGSTEQQDFPRDSTFKDIMDGYLTMGKGIIEQMDKKNISPSDDGHLKK